MAERIGMVLHTCDNGMAEVVTDRRNACGGCEKEGNCVIQDDMQLLYPKITEADRIIIASPIYFYGVTAQTKAFSCVGIIN